jgi:flavodoxin
MSSRILVTYYSRTGHTKLIAERIATELGADLAMIDDRKDRAGLLGYLRSTIEALFQRVVNLAPSIHDPSTYDVVIIGTPIWDMTLSSPVRSYLHRHAERFQRVAFFCTCGGMGMQRVFAQMAEIAGKQPLATLAVREAELDGSADAVARFVSELRPKLPVEAPRPAVTLPVPEPA